MRCAVGGGGASRGLGGRLGLALSPLIAAAALLGWAPSAFGHAAFVESEPAPGLRLERAPDEVVLRFTESLDPELSELTVVDAASGQEVAASTEDAGDGEVVVRPADRLDSGAYRVDWHTVSPRDGHALEGSFSFGVRAPAVGGEHQVEQGPLARSGWLRVGARGVLYGSLFFFAGGVLIAAAFGRGRGGGGWLVPDALLAPLARLGENAARRRDRLWRRTVDAGWVAVAAATAVALVEAVDASGGLAPGGLSAYLLSNLAGAGRVATVLALVVATLLAARSRIAGAAAAIAAAFLAIALSGHASSADPGPLAVATDWVHLLAAAVWIGGIGQIALAWVPLLRRSSRELRLGVVRDVLHRFGTLALPAFAVLAATGLVNALIQLGQPEALWESSYGRVLAAKIALVGAIAAASSWHALRLRPRLLSANPHPPWRIERRHWRLVAGQPVVAAAAVAAAALLVAFPLPPRQLGEAGQAEASPPEETACDPCPQQRPRADELAVAEQAGSSVAAVWLHREGRTLRGELRLLDANAKPVDASAMVVSARQRACGTGCWRFRIEGRPRTVEVEVPEGGETNTARLPARWQPAKAGRARAILERAERTMRDLDSVREHERITSGPGTLAVTDYRLRAPNRLAYEVDGGGRSIVVGGDQWSRPGGEQWDRREFGAGAPFRTRSWFRWTPYARAVRLLSVRREDGRRLAEVALADELTPVWYTLTIELRRMYVVDLRMIAGGHFMDQRYFAFNRPIEIEPPQEVADVR